MPLPLLALLLVLGAMFVLWIVSLAKRDVSIIDGFWGLGFVLVGWTYFLWAPGESLRGGLVVSLVTLWGGRLSAYILWRRWGEPEDYRYREMRERYGRAFPWLSLFLVFFLQAGILWVVSLSLYQVQRTSVPAGLGVLDIAGVLLFATGFSFEALGDWQLARFKANPANRGRVLDSGLWRYTRHPNYFGDALVWWSFFLFALATPSSAWTLVSPLVMTALLMKVSGVPLLEKRMAATRPEYRDYVERTSAFFPWPPRRDSSARPR